MGKVVRSWAPLRGRVVALAEHMLSRSLDDNGSPLPHAMTHAAHWLQARFILMTPTSRRQSAAHILTHTNIWLVHTPAFDAVDLSLRSIRLDGVSICRVQSSWTPASSRRQSLTIIQSQASIHGLISVLSLPRYVIWGRSRLQQIVMVEMNAPCCSNGPTRHRISSRISGIMRRYLG